MTALIVLDPGAGNFKVIVGDGGRTRQNESRVIVPAWAGTPRGQEFRPQEGVDVPKDQPLSIQFDSNRFITGYGAHSFVRVIADLDDTRFTGSPVGALTYDALTRLWPTKEEEKWSISPARMIVGLPQSAYEIHREDPDQAVVSWLQRKHEWEANGKPYKLDIQEVKVTSQPIGIFFGWMLNTEGGVNMSSVQDYKSGRPFGAISIGASTVELNATIGAEVQPVYSASKPLGVRELLDSIDGDFGIPRADAMLRRGELNYTPFLEGWWAKIRGLVEESWKDEWRQFCAIRVAGGGALLLERQIQRYFGGKAKIADEPYFAVAEGLFRWGLGAAKWAK